MRRTNGDAVRAEPVTDVNGLRDWRLQPPPEGSHLGRVLVILAAFLLGFFCGTATAAERCVRLTVRPSVMIQRNDIDVQTRVCRDPAHRRLRIEWDSDRGWAGSSDTQLAGAAAPVAYQFWLHDYPPATYDFTASTFNGLGQVVASDRARILAPDRR